VDQYGRVNTRPTSHGPVRGVATSDSNTATFAVHSADVPRRMNIYNAKKILSKKYTSYIKHRQDTLLQNFFKTQYRNV
jgi:hypothetical protein